MYRVVDVMDSSGGFALGIVQSGLRLVGIRDIEYTISVANCEANRHILKSTWQAQIDDSSSWTIPGMDIDAVFSSQTHIAHAKLFIEYVARSAASIAVFESYQLARISNDAVQIMQDFREHLECASDRKWDLYCILYDSPTLRPNSYRKSYFCVLSTIPFGIDRLEYFKANSIDDLNRLSLTWEFQSSANGVLIDGSTLIQDVISVTHPYLPRNITHREAARLLGFPDEWMLYPLRDVPGLDAMWRKSLHVSAGRWISEHIARALDGSPGNFQGTSFGERSWHIDMTIPADSGMLDTIVTPQSRQRRPMTEVQEQTEDLTNVNADGWVNSGEVMSSTTDTEAPAPKRGRNRPADTIARDAEALNLIRSTGTEGMTRDELAKALMDNAGGEFVSSNVAYLSIHRLAGTGDVHRIRRNKASRWVTSEYVEEALKTSDNPDNVSKAERDRVKAENAAQRAAERARKAEERAQIATEKARQAMEALQQRHQEQS